MEGPGSYSTCGITSTREPVKHYRRQLMKMARTLGAGICIANWSSRGIGEAIEEWMKVAAWVSRLPNLEAAVTWARRTSTMLGKRRPESIAKGLIGCERRML